MKRITVPFFISHKGCPHTCSFCDQKTISGSAGELPTSLDIISKIDAWRVSSNTSNIVVAFFGGSFTALPIQTQEQLLMPLQALRTSGEVTSIKVSTRPDCIDHKTVTRLAEYGVDTIELGVQSMDDGVLSASGRGHLATDSDSAIKCIKSCGLNVVAQLMPGLPGDSLIKSIESLKRVIYAGVDAIRIYPTLVLRGTQLADQFTSGRYSPPDLTEGINICKKLLHIALVADVKILRIGLQADDGLNAQTVLAGCWHPALGQLVRSQLYFDLINRIFARNHFVKGDYVVTCHPTRVSDIAGNKRIHIKHFHEQGVNIYIQTDSSLQKEQIVIKHLNDNIMFNIITDLNYTA